jgi:hypothetical protein
MGGAFSAIADDATAMFWNPAGLTRIAEDQISFAHADLFGTGITDDQISFVLPVASNPIQVLASHWYHSGFDDGELGFSENRFGLAYALGLGAWGSVGVTGKFTTRNTSLDGFSVRDGKGVGADVGVMLDPIEGVTLALVAQDIFDTKLDYQTGGSSVAYSRNVRVAAAYRVPRLGTAALDMDDRLHIALEATPRSEFALRTGLRKEFETDEDPTYAFGAGFKASIFRLDYAYEVHPVLGSTNHFSLSLGFHLNPSRIRIQKVEPEELYASLFRSYDR